MFHKIKPDCKRAWHSYLKEEIANRYAVEEQNGCWVHSREELNRLKNEIGLSWKKLEKEQKEKWLAKADAMYVSPWNRVTCEPSKFQRTTKNFTDTQRVAAYETGLGGLLELEETKLDFGLIPWLVSNVDCKTATLTVHGTTVPLSPELFCTIMRIEDGLESIDLEQKVGPFDDLSRRFIVKKGGRMVICWKKLEATLLNPELDDDMFKIAYTLYAIGRVIAPPKRQYLSAKHFIPVHDVARIRHKRWGLFGLQLLMENIRNSQTKLPYVMSGCILFLQLLYFQLFSVSPTAFAAVNNFLPEINAPEMRIDNLLDDGVVALSSYKEQGADETIQPVDQPFSPGQLINLDAEDDYVRQLKSQIAALEDQVNFLNSELWNRDDLHKKVTEEFEELQYKLEVDSKRLRERNEELESQLNSSEVKELRGEVELLRRKLDTVETQNAALHRDLRRLESDNSTLRISNYGLKNKLDDAKQMIERLQEELCVARPVEEITHSAMASSADPKVLTSNDVCTPFVPCEGERAPWPKLQSPFVSAPIRKSVSYVTVGKFYLRKAEFTDDELKTIEYVFQPGLSATEVLVEATESHITRKEMQSLAPTCHLYDSVPNTFLAMLQSELILDGVNNKENWFCNTWVTDRAMKSYDSFSALIAGIRTRNASYFNDLHACNKIYFLHCASAHFNLFVVDIRTQTVEVWDSLRKQQHVYDSQVQALLQSLDLIFEDVVDKVSFSTFKTQVVLDAAVQPNGYDCGLFAMRFIESGHNYAFSQWDSVHERARTITRLILSPYNTVRENVVNKVRDVVVTPEVRRGTRGVVAAKKLIFSESSVEEVTSAKGKRKSPLEKRYSPKKINRRYLT